MGACGESALRGSTLLVSQRFEGGIVFQIFREDFLV